MRVTPTVLSMVVGAVAFAMLPLHAQWPQVKTKRVPLAPNGKPDLTAPAPKTAGGKTPDFSGLWNSIKVPCEGSAAGAVFGCSDVPFGVPIGLFDVTANGSQEGQSGTTQNLPYQPDVEASVRQHLADNRKDDPTTVVCRSLRYGSGRTSSLRRSCRPRMQ